MPKSKETPSTYLDNVAEILYGSHDQMTQDHHLAVVERGLNPKLDAPNRALVFDYARANLSDPEVLDTTLLKLAKNEIDGVRFEAYPDIYMSKENQQRYDQAKAVVAEIVSAGFRSGEGVLADTFKLLLDLEKALKPPTVDFRKAYTGIDAPRDELADMAVNCIKAMENRYPVQFETFAPRHQLYLEQIDFLTSGLGRSSETSDELIKTVLPLLNENHDNTVSACMNLLGSTKDDDLKRSIYRRAVEITAASVKEPNLEVSHRSSWFGIIRTQSIEKPSVFEQRLNILSEQIDSKIQLRNMLSFYPEYIARVANLHPTEVRETVWQSYADEIAALAFTDGHYKIGEIGQIMSTVEKFSQIAPSEVGNYARAVVKQRLAQSTPTRA